MSITTVLWKNQEELILSFREAIISGMYNTWERCDRKPPEEADFVAGLAIDSTKIIYSALNKVLASPQFSTSIYSVFCHNVPKVSFDGQLATSCELGDILFAYVHTPKSGPTLRNAILFQAKLHTKQPYKIPMDQLRLYTEWPDFVYQRSSFLTGQKRYVTPKAPHSGAQYLLIDGRPMREWPWMHPMGCCMPDKTLREHTFLPHELFNMFIFRTGRPFDDKNTAMENGDWSQVVWDILETGLKKAFNRKNSHRHNNPRGTRYTLQMIDGESVTATSSLQTCSTAKAIIGDDNINFSYAHNDGEPPSNNDLHNDVDETEMGISVVLIETSEREA